MFNVCVEVMLFYVSISVSSLLIDFVTPKPEGGPQTVWDWQGYLYAVLLFISALLSTLFMAQYSHRMYMTAMRVRTVLVSAIYRKALIISNSSKRGQRRNNFYNKYISYLLYKLYF